MNDLFKKLYFKEQPIIVNVPTTLRQSFVSLGCSFAFDKKDKSTSTLVFINSRQEYLDFLNTNLKKIAPDSVLWFAYPKGTSKIKTDINRDTLRVTGEGFGITTVSAISIDEIWSALRFRPIDKVGK